jgi:uncharacterized protein YggE
VIAAVIKVANGAGVAGDDIRTVGLTISRSRVKPKRKPAYTRYSARQYQQIRVRDVSKLGPLLDAVADDDESGYEEPASGGGGSRADSLNTSVSPGTQQFVERVRVVYTAAPL